MSSGFCVLMDIGGKTIEFIDAPKGMKTAKLGNCKRISSRSSLLVEIHPLSL